ncbi:type II secretion system minor pseudopilin GspH [Aestuariibacter halophilus]|uniref:Type II secretion system protein H n=1 Tax=Fluctibacter halophilus TaxID=226011 RepID=A0ABS8GBE1_9ALTE|nr:type II secretion system minor pseudopilin GspH [Aestuariibacter halophilus]MCC2617049.1 type II secretion system minor pseudopilin GspH [Aestuariibacter halophilus]
MSMVTRSHKGFTLLEVMLVLVIMGFSVSYVLFNAFGQTPVEGLQKEAQRFQVVVDMASDFAVLNQQQLGIYIDDDLPIYRFMILDEEERWRWLEDSKAFAEHRLQEPFTLMLELEDLPWAQEDNLFDDNLFDESLSVSDDQTQIGDEEDKPLPPPQILILSSGDITPFSLAFAYEPTFSSDDPVYFRVNAIDLPPLEREGPLDSL